MSSRQGAEVILRLDMTRQPDDTTCGPTCLHAVYDFWNDTVPLEDLIREVPTLETGGTLGVFLALHALRRGYRARVYTCNLQVFDPTWFADNGHAKPGLRDRLKARGDALADDAKMGAATTAYAEFLDLGGEIHMVDLTPRMIASHLRRGEPILTGLSSTWLYRAMREFGPEDDDDDIRGMPNGHFVIVVGYDPGERRVHVADPMPHPLAKEHTYSISIDRLVCAILLGIVTWDANLLILTPQVKKKASPHADRR